MVSKPGQGTRDDRVAALLEDNGLSELRAELVREQVELPEAFVQQLAQE